MGITWEQSEDVAVIQRGEQARREKRFWMDLKVESAPGCPERWTEYGMGKERSERIQGFWLQQLEDQLDPFDDVPRISKIRWWKQLRTLLVGVQSGCLCLQGNQAASDRVADLENRLKDTVGEREGGANWESSVDLYTEYTCVQSHQSCLTLCDTYIHCHRLVASVVLTLCYPVDCSPPGSCVHGVL